MVQDVLVQVAGDYVILRCPFSPGLGDFVNDMGGRWNHELGQYEFPVALEPHVRALAWSFFSTDGTAPLATFELDASLRAAERRIEIAGRVLAERVSTSRRPKLSGATKIRGDWQPGAGLAVRPLLGENSAVLLVTLPASIASHNIPGLRQVEPVNLRTALINEFNALTARLTTIQHELSR